MVLPDLGVLTVEATPDAVRGRVPGAQNTVLLAAPALAAPVFRSLDDPRAGQKTLSPHLANPRARSSV